MSLWGRAKLKMGQTNRFRHNHVSHFLLCCVNFFFCLPEVVRRSEYRVCDAAHWTQFQSVLKPRVGVDTHTQTHKGKYVPWNTGLFHLLSHRRVRGEVDEWVSFFTVGFAISVLHGCDCMMWFCVENAAISGEVLLLDPRETFVWFLVYGCVNVCAFLSV